jgi:putative transposase
MRDHRAEYPIQVMRSVLGVSRSGYYAFLSRKESPRHHANARLLEEIKRVHRESRGTYGSPRVHARLVQEKVPCGRNRVARLMRESGIQGKVYARYRRIARMKPRKDVAENLLCRRFDVAKPDRVWVADITCFWSGSGWLHLAVVLDLYSRRIIGWSMSGRMTEKLAVGALDMALLSRSPLEGLIHHSDQGVQYMGGVFKARLRENGILPSMSRRGDCYDNAVVESFFKSLKYELIKDRTYRTREDARREIFDYIEVFYNRRRLHSKLGYMSPVEYERQNMPIKSVH